MFFSRFSYRAFHDARCALFRKPAVNSHTHTSFHFARVRTYRAINHQRLLVSWNALRIWIRNPMFRYHVSGIGLFCGIFYLYYLERVPISGRLRFNIVSVHWEKQLGNAWFQREIENHGHKLLPQSSEEHNAVHRVLDRLISHTDMTNESWEVRVIDDSEMSGFVLPGGKVFVHRGVLDLCVRDDELAVVLGHEIAHNVARHTSERLSRWLILIPVIMISSLLSGMNEDLVQLGIDIAFRLPHTRAHEKEADYLGMLIMAESGYDPSAAIDLWSRWEEVDEERAPTFLSTHPSHHSRLCQFHDWLAQACKTRLSHASRAPEFSEAYCLQRTFCGIERDFTTKGKEPE